MESTEFKVGDVVKFKASFLQSVQWYTDVPMNGVVKELLKYGNVLVAWCDGYESGVHPKNIMLNGKPDYSGL
jgi:hypothetical protein